MKTVTQKKFFDYFKLDKDYTILSNFYYRNYQFFNRVTFLFFVLAGFIILGFYQNIFFAVAITLVFFIFFLYLTPLMISEVLTAKRTFPFEAKEGDSIEISLCLENHSWFPLYHFLITDIFYGSNIKIEKKYISGSLASKNMYIINYYRVCDAGMGKKNFGPLIILISDPLGVFEFKVEFEFDDHIMVMPAIEQLLPFPVRGTHSSHKSGHYDLSLKGRSITFHGVRDYIKGDPLSHIHWRLSIHRRHLVVKEFEKTVNSQITLLMNMSSKLHMGQGGQSTWEYMRDIALSISDQQLAQNNNIQIITNKQMIPFGEGKNFIQYLELLMPKLSPVTDKFGDFFVRRNLNIIPYASSVFYFSPILPDKVFIQNLMDLKNLISAHCQIFVILIDGIEYMSSITTGEQKGFFKNLEQEKQNLVTKIISDLNKRGVICTIVPITAIRESYKESFNHA